MDMKRNRIADWLIGWLKIAVTQEILCPGNRFASYASWRLNDMC